MKILFCEPMQAPIERIKKYNLRPVGLRLGPLYLASFIESNMRGVTVKIQENRLRKFENIVFDVEDEIQEQDIVAVSCCTNEFPDGFRLLKIAKTLNKVTVAGGLFPSANSEYVLSTGLVDYVVHGEGEIALVKLLACLAEKGNVADVGGISYLRDGKVFHNRPGTFLEDPSIVPAYHLVSLASYAQYERGPIMTARGCPHTCVFCTLAPHWGRKYRAQSVETVIKQINTLGGAGFKSLNVIDETFTIDRGRTEELLRRVIAEKGKNGISAMPIKIKARIDTIDPSLIALMKEANIDMIQIGVETINPERLSGLSKNLKTGSTERQLDMILEAGIGLNPIFIFGYQGETRDNLRKDIDFIKRIGTKPNVTTFLAFNTPHPGSYEWMNSQEIGLRIITGDLSYYNHKMLVCVPNSLGKPRYAAELLLESYNQTVEAIQMQHENPYLENLFYITDPNPTMAHIGELSF